MVFAAINACPVPGGKLKSVDDAPLAAAPGVLQVVRLPDAVAVVATGSFWRAKQALAKLHPEWDVGDAGTTDSAQFSREYHAALDGPAEVARNDGNVDEALPKAAKTLEAVYETPYLAHAPMEPMNATVHFQPDRLDIWIGTQAADQTIENAARLSGLKPEQIHIHNCFIGGGFGRKSANDEMVQAIAIAKAVQRPRGQNGRRAAARQGTPDTQVPATGAVLITWFSWRFSFVALGYLVGLLGGRMVVVTARIRASTPASLG
jgi:isoquinoline 1-oxidoreductase beta subunit